MKRFELLKHFDTFVFDWDGTLNSIKFILMLNQRLNPHWRYKQKKQGSPDYKKDQYSRRAAQDLMKKRAIEGTLLPLGDISLFFMKPKLHNDTKEVLEILKKRNKKIVLLTNGAQYRVLKELNFLDIENYFDMIVSTQELKALKPNPLGIEIVIKKLHANKSRVLYTGDMVDDIVMAKYAKIHSCALASGMDSLQKLKSMKPDYLFESMEEFKKAL